MALERRPAEKKDEPGYPNSENYRAGRRTFLGMLGATAATAAGFFFLKDKPGLGAGCVGPSGAPPPALPQAAPNGKMLPPKIQPPAPPPALPQAAPGGEPLPPKIQPPVQPQAQVPGGIRAPQPQSGPQACAPGESAVPNSLNDPKEPQPPRVEPLANPAGGLRAPAFNPAPVQPQAPMPGNKKVIVPPDPPPVRPRAATKGDTAAPVPPPKPPVQEDF